LNRRLRLGVFVAGLALAAAIILQTGLGTLASELARAWWVVLPLVVLWGGVYACNTAAWRGLLRTEPAYPGPVRIFAITVTSFALNYLTPVVSLGGEAYRVAAVQPWLGRRRAAGSVVQYRLLHSLAHMLFILTAVVAAVWALPPTAAGFRVLAAAAALGLLLAWVIILGHRDGVLERCLDLLRRIPLVRRYLTPLEARRETLKALDCQITDAYREHPGPFWRAIGLEYLSRCLTALEIALIIWGLGLGWQPFTAMVASGLSSALANLLFFIPFELGAREGGLFVTFGLLGIGAEHGVAAALLTRLRELVWMIAGLGLVWAGGVHLPLRREAAE
jgi:uncharacterized protein (TIRG00374 family)